MPPELADQIMRALDQAAKEGSARFEYSVTVGVNLYFEARLVRCGPGKVLVVARDVTESKRAQHEAERVAAVSWLACRA